ncbi:MAG TPA: DUF3300 domain-containing protein [Tepidisphaeraceae bacterium]|nr:DUF3300 domain-containing protein [Tepidisphaeraceae bacterium]
MRSAGAQLVPDGDAYAPLGPEDLQPLAAPVALYPDAMLAQILVACTYPNDVVAAAQYLDGGGDPNAIDDQGWDLSVAGVARYPDLLHYMASNGDWMNSLGAAFLNQQADVMNAVQVLRSEALAAGNLVSNDQQTVINDNGTIEIIPTDPQNIYPPIYDPTLVYQPPVEVVGQPYVPLIRYWHGIPCGVWLHHDLDWHDHTIYVGSWGADRPWWRHDAGHGAYDYTHDRPGLFINKADIQVHDHNRVVNVRAGAWNRQMHDPKKAMPKYVNRPAARPAAPRPGTGYEAAHAPAERAARPAINNYNHAPTVAQQSQRGRESLEKGGVRPENKAPARPAEAPVRHAVPAPEPHAAAPARVEQPREQPRAAAPARSEPPRNEPAQRSAAGGYGNGAEASRASNRGAASRGAGKR